MTLKLIIIISNQTDFSQIVLTFFNGFNQHLDFLKKCWLVNNICMTSYYKQLRYNCLLQLTGWFELPFSCVSLPFDIFGVLLLINLNWNFKNNDK